MKPLTRSALSAAGMLGGLTVALRRRKHPVAAQVAQPGRHAGTPLPLETELALAAVDHGTDTARHAGEPRDEVIEDVERAAGRRPAAA